MLRVSPGHAAPAFPGAVALRPRVAKAVPVVPQPLPSTIAVRGHVRNGSAAALIVEPGGICLVSADRSRRRRVRRFGIDEVLAVEEHRTAQSTELVVVTATTVISVVDVDIAQAWTFCRELRELILTSAPSSRSRES
jgi:hypothetical protein